MIIPQSVVHQKDKVIDYALSIGGTAAIITEIVNTFTAIILMMLGAYRLYVFHEERKKKKEEEKNAVTPVP